MIWVAALTTWLGVLLTLPAMTRRVSPVVPRLIRYVGGGTMLFDGQKLASDLPWFLIGAGFIAEAIASTWANLQVTPEARSPAIFSPGTIGRNVIGGTGIGSPASHQLLSESSSSTAM